MNKLIKHINLYRDESKKIPFNDTQPTLRVDNNFPDISSIVLDCEDIIKSLLIKFKGNIIRIPSMHTEGFFVKCGNKKLRLINFNKKPLKNKILLKFVGSIDKITFSEIHFWGGAKSKGVKFDNSSDLISKNDNIVSSNSIIISDDKKSKRLSSIDGKIKRLKPFMIKKRTNKININFLYTSGHRLSVNGKYYVGHYHYDVQRKKFRTKGYSMPESKNLEIRDIDFETRRKHAIQ